jgi:hypothetical protein
MTAAPKITSRSRIVERDDRVCAFDRKSRVIGSFRTRIEAMRTVNLVEQADAVLKFDMVRTEISATAATNARSRATLVPTPICATCALASPASISPAG